MVTPEAVPYTCERCQQPVTEHDDGVLFITAEDHQAALDQPARAPVLRSDEPLDGEAIARHALASRPAGYWQMMHHRCLGEFNDEAFGYSVEASRIRDYRGLLGLLVHLDEKTWMPATNLHAWIRQFSSDF